MEIKKITIFGQPLQIKICLRTEGNERRSKKKNQLVGLGYTLSPGQEVATINVTRNTGEFLTSKNCSGLEFSKVLFISWW